MAKLTIAYLDEYPWMRCCCGWTLNWDMNSPCPGCGNNKTIVSYRDRFGNGENKNGQWFKPVSYEDANRRVF